MTITDLHFKEGYIAKYIGNSKSSFSIVRNKSVGTILKHKMMNEVNMVFFKPIGIEEKFWINRDELRPIRTTVEHLGMLGFTRNGNLFENEKYGLNISSCAIITGDCFGEIGGSATITDLYIAACYTITKNDLKKFIVSDEFCLEEFYKEYPNVGNLKELVFELEKRGLEVDIEELIKNSYK